MNRMIQVCCDILLLFKITQNESNDPKGSENIICTIMMYRETFTAATWHNISCSGVKLVLNTVNQFIFARDLFSQYLRDK